MTGEELLQTAKPILFNTEMVRAILDGRKTVTRRCVKTKSKNACGFYVTFRKSDNALMGVYDYDENEMQFDSPQTQPAYPGDILYVRETIWQKVGHYLDVDGETKPSWYKEFKYVATDEKPETGWNYSWVKRPSIHMPKEATRIWLKVTDVRVERLQDITEEQASKEGAIDNRGFIHSPDNEYTKIHTAKEHFIDIWSSTIKKFDLDTYGWDANPWVWVIEFEQCEKPLECEFYGYDKAPDDGSGKCLGYMYDNEDALIPMCEKCRYQASYESEE